LIQIEAMLASMVPAPTPLTREEIIARARLVAHGSPAPRNSTCEQGARGPCTETATNLETQES
jgi:hypothetical protein